MGGSASTLGGGFPWIWAPILVFWAAGVVPNGAHCDFLPVPGLNSSRSFTWSRKWPCILFLEIWKPTWRAISPQIPYISKNLSCPKGPYGPWDDFRFSVKTEFWLVITSQISLFAKNLNFQIIMKMIYFYWCISLRTSCLWWGRVVIFLEYRNCDL